MDGVDHRGRLTYYYVSILCKSKIQPSYHGGPYNLTDIACSHNMLSSNYLIIPKKKSTITPINLSKHGDKDVYTNHYLTL